MPEDAPEKWAEYIEYNRQDVVVEKAIRKRLLSLKPPAIESTSTGYSTKISTGEA